jgi:hypothetical protein
MACGKGPALAKRTTLDVLDASKPWVNARVALMTASMTGSWPPIRSWRRVGGLSPQILGLKFESYDAMVHYQWIRDAWGGVRIPDRC